VNNITNTHTFMNYMKFSSLYLLLIGLFIFPRYQGNINTSVQTNVGNKEDIWLHIVSDLYADSVMQTMTLEQKIAQLIIMDVYPNKNESYYKTIDKWVTEKKIGGILLFRGQPTEITKIINRYTKQSEIPLWVAIDGEWGVSMRVDSIRPLPKAMTLGAITDNELIRQYGYHVGLQCRRMGFNMNMAPVADVNCNPKNPVINYRSFGEDRKNVALKSIAYYMGMHDAEVIAVAKHFPGHGNTDTDSHYQLPIIKDSYAEIDSIHLYPFKELIKYGIPAIMNAHLYVHALDSTPELASSLSPAIISSLLIEKLGYKGLIMTDALGMKGVANHFAPGEIEVRALQAGNDILLMPQKPQVAIDAIIKAIKSGQVSEELINSKCRKVLKMKYLYIYEQKAQQFKETEIPAELNDSIISDFMYEIYSNAHTMLTNRNHFFPLRSTQNSTFAVVSVGKTGQNTFHSHLQKQFQYRHFELSSEPSDSDIDRIKKSVTQFDKVLICIFGMNNSPKRNYGIHRQIVKLTDALRDKNKTALLLFGNPYALNFVNNPTHFASVIVGYEETVESERAMADIVSGINVVKGKLPVSTDYFPYQTGITAYMQTGLQTIMPSELNINTNALKKIDALIADAISQQAMPGCQILISQHGKVFFHKAYGYHTYEKEIPVDLTDVYDLASLTKILATTAAVMSLFDKNMLLLQATVDTYLQEFKGTQIGSIKINEILTHQSGLPSWIAFYRELIQSDTLRQEFLSQSFSADFPIQIADNLFTKASYRDTIFKRFVERPIGRKNYLYSDIGFYLLQAIVEELAKLPFEEYVRTTFYEPMQITSLVFNPTRIIDKSRIVPTEFDNEFRKQLIHGFVHDQGAGLLGGISGHAGLFGNAMDVAVMMQMFLNKGVFEGKRYIDSVTVEMFTMKQFPNNRRGLGFDKPTNQKGTGSSADEASPLSFGHTGFTGTFAWSDPKHNLTVVFLSNRIYPSASNRKLSDLQVRRKVHQLAYHAINVY
jgi:beta-N-acetylhexosaminidase